MRCESCGNSVVSGHLTGGVFSCTKCPPILILTSTWYSNALFNKAANRILEHPMTFYEGCGFRVFKHTTFLKYNISREVKEFFLLRYFGSVKCKLIRNYDWPAEIKTCECNSC